MENNESNNSPFKDYAEDKVTEDLNKNQHLLKQRYMLAINIGEMGQQLSKNQWERVWKGVTAPVLGKKVELQNALEEQMVKQIRNFAALEAYMIIADDRLYKAAVKELQKMREIVNQKDLKEGNE